MRSGTGCVESPASSAPARRTRCAARRTPESRSIEHVNCKAMSASRAGARTGVSNAETVGSPNSRGQARPRDAKLATRRDRLRCCPSIFCSRRAPKRFWPPWHRCGQPRFSLARTPQQRKTRGSSRQIKTTTIESQSFAVIASAKFVREKSTHLGGIDIVLDKGLADAAHQNECERAAPNLFVLSDQIHQSVDSRYAAGNIL